MADTYTYLTDSGLIVVDAPVIQKQVIDEYVAVFGDALVVPSADALQASSTPQGLLINTEALARIALADNNAALANQINPNVSGGIFLDSLMVLTGAFREPATSSTVFATLNGVPGTIIPSGSQASETGSGVEYVFETIIANVIPSSGSLVNVTFLSVIQGAIPCPAGTLTVIVSNVIGWESISNSTEPTPLGTERQSDASARLSRNTQIGVQGSSLAGAMIGGISQAIGSTGSIKFLENTSNITAVVEGITMVSHSIYACVDATVDKLGTKTTVIATLGGVAGTVIPVGTQATTGTYIFNTLTEVTIPAGGLIDVEFQAVASGVVPCLATTLNTRITVIAGWNTVTNAFGPTNLQTVVIGTITGTPATVIPLNSIATSAGNIFQTLIEVTIPASGTIQTTFQSIVGDSVSCPAGTLNTIDPAIAGWTSINNALGNTNSGTESPIALAMVQTKSAGAAYNNGLGTSQQAMIIVPYSSQQMIVLYDTPVIIQISVRVTIKIITPVINAVQAVKDAIKLYIDGGIAGLPGLGVGKNVSAFELSGAVTALHPGIYVQSLFISLTPTTPTLSTEIPIGAYEKADIVATSIVVLIV